MIKRSVYRPKSQRIRSHVPNTRAFPDSRRGSKTQAKNVRAQKENNGDNRLSLRIYARESDAP